MEDEKKSIVFLIFSIFLSLFLIIYATYHIFSGKYGFLGYRNINNFLEKQKSILYKSKNEVKRKKNRVDRLKSNNLDLDLFEEEIKRNVGVVENEEIVLFTDDIVKN